MVSINADASLSGLKTGDLVLFTGQGLARGFARWFNRSPWTHVGLVLRGPIAAEPLLWEALWGGPRRGTIAAPLAGRMARSGGRISVRCLNRPLAPTQCQRLEALRQEVSERARARGLLDLIGAPTTAGSAPGAKISASRWTVSWWPKPTSVPASGRRSPRRQAPAPTGRGISVQSGLELKAATP